MRTKMKPTEAGTIPNFESVEARKEALKAQKASRNERLELLQNEQARLDQQKMDIEEALDIFEYDWEILGQEMLEEYMADWK